MRGSFLRLYFNRPNNLNLYFAVAQGSNSGAIAAAVEPQMQGNSNKAFDHPADMNL